jgi:hypothetical protein
MGDDHARPAGRAVDSGNQQTLEANAPMSVFNRSFVQRHVPPSPFLSP